MTSRTAAVRSAPSDSPTRSDPPPAPYNTKARVAVFVYTALLLAFTQLPPLFPPNLPTWRVPFLLATAATTGVLAALLILRPPAPRPLVLALGWVQCLLTLTLSFVIGDILVMFCCWISIPVLALLAGQLKPRPRKALFAAHVISSASWVGIAVVTVALALVAMTTSDLKTAIVVYELMAAFDITLLPWANFAATLTGIALGLTTRWGLVRYYWVAIKLTISLLILFSAFAYVEGSLEAIIEEAKHAAAVGGAVPQTSATVVLAGFGVPCLSLVAAMLLSIYKPGGKTRRGKRLSAKPPGGVPPLGGTPPLDVTIAETKPVADGTLALTLQSTSGGALPPGEPGAHIDLVLPSGLVRQYSLSGDPADAGTYQVAVLREPAGRGGSAEIHRLAVGTRLEVRGPRNKFPLVDAPAYLFLAGGIGIAPFLPMIRQLDRAGADWRLVYRGRSAATMAFADDLVSRYPERVSLLPADTRPRPYLAGLLAGTPPGVAVYCCGTEPMLRAVEELMPTACPHGTLHTERFVPTVHAGVNTAFEAELRRSGVVVEVPADGSLLDAIHDVEPALDSSCTDGVCGSCVTRVLSGVPDHRDDVLQANERDRTDVIYPCVSRSLSPRLVLDL